MKKLQCKTASLPKSVVIDGETITYKDFSEAMLMYGMAEGYSYDGFSIGMTWLGVVENKPRPDQGENETERTQWLPVLKEYLKG